MRNGKNYSLKVTKNGQMINKCNTHSLRTFLKSSRSINWQSEDIKAYIKVSYGKKINYQGKQETFYNDGVYDNENDLSYAFNCFNEEV